MKKTIITIISTALITSSIFALGMELNPAKEVAAESPVIETKPITETQFEQGYYPLLMVVTEVDTETDIITAEDGNGFEWEFVCDDAYVNDLYSCIMCDNGTEEIDDDEIVRMRYSGQVMLYATESMIDMENVTGYEKTETGIMLNFADGTGYYFEK